MAQLLGFVGPNGAGKSTTMRMLLGVERSDSGTACIDGLVLPPGVSAGSRVGSFLDARWMNPELSALAQLKAVEAILGCPGPLSAEDVLDLVGLASARTRRIDKLSLGMRQRLGIGIALLSNSTNYIFDEPINGLDPDGVIWFRKLVMNLALNGAAILLSSHLMSELDTMIDGVVILNKGRIMADVPSLKSLGVNATPHVSITADDVSFVTYDPDIEIVRGPFAEDGRKRVVVAGSTPEAIFLRAKASGAILSELRAEVSSVEALYRSAVSKEDDDCE